MADVSKIKLPNGTTYNIKDAEAYTLGDNCITISANTDLNTIKTVGNYRCTGTATARSLTNCPTDVWFTMRVGLADGASSTWLYQEIIDGNNNWWRRYYAGSYWIDWVGVKAKEAFLEWGGKNFSASYGPIDAAMINELGANRFAFLKAEGITIEYSTDGGSTWLDYESSDVAKTGLFGKGHAHYLGKHSTNGTSTLNDMLRITIATGAARVYTNLNKIAIYMSTSGNTVQVLMEKALENTPTNYVTHLDWTGIAGWSGWNILNVGGIVTYGNAPASQYGRIRFTFKQTAVTTTYSAALISRIMAFGGVGWTTPSNLATDGHLYSYDNAQNATFPSHVTAVRFNGPLVGNVTGNVSGTASNVTGTVAVANGGTGQTTAKNAANVFLNALDNGTSTPVDADYYISQFVGGGTSTTTYHRRPMSALWNYIESKISSVLGLTTTNYGGKAATAGTADSATNASKVNNHTVNSDVPSNAKFTDTTISMSMDTTDTKKLIISLT